MPLSGAPITSLRTAAEASSRLSVSLAGANPLATIDPQMTIDMKVAITQSKHFLVSTIRTSSVQPTWGNQQMKTRGSKKILLVVGKQSSDPCRQELVC
jgi:hypothetical protein